MVTTLRMQEGYPAAEMAALGNYGVQNLLDRWSAGCRPPHRCRSIAIHLQSISIFCAVHFCLSLSLAARPPLPSSFLSNTPRAQFCYYSVSFIPAQYTACLPNSNFQLTNDLRYETHDCYLSIPLLSNYSECLHPVPLQQQLPQQNSQPLFSTPTYRQIA